MVNLASPVGMVNLATPVGVVNLASPFGVGNLATPVGVVNLASPVGMVNLATPVGMVNLATPFGVGNLAKPVGAIDPAVKFARTGKRESRGRTTYTAILWSRAQAFMPLGSASALPWGCVRLLRARVLIVACSADGTAMHLPLTSPSPQTLHMRSVD